MGMAAEPQFHVLAVDDSLIDRKLIERLLKTSSYQVTTVDSGSKALEFLGLQEDDDDDYEELSNTYENQPSVCPHSQQVSFSPRKKEVEVNLIITDYCMPGMTGYDLLKKVKESSAFRNIPVVIMSSENVPSRINRCLEEGAEEFFLKPVRLADVNRLRPHMLRAKYGQQKQDLLQECQKPEHKSEQQQQQQQQQQQTQQQKLLHQQQQQQQRSESGQQTELQQQKQEAEQQQQLNNSKRKSIEIEEGLSPDRTRPRYNGLTTMV